MKKAQPLLRLLPILLALSDPDPLGAQVPRRTVPTVLFAPTGNFQNPGARSFALGGAFVALADDASAAELNPAGLTQLRRPEISMEFRQMETVVPVRYAGAAAISGHECVFPAQLGSGRCDNTNSYRANSLSFVSLIVPGSAGLTYALYRHELDRERFRSVRPALSIDLPAVMVSGQAQGSFQDLDRRLVRTGLSLAYSFHPRFSAGATVNLNSMTQSFRSTEFGTVAALGQGNLGGEPSIVWELQETRINAQRVGATGGLLWRPATPLSLGVSYSTRVRFEEINVRNTCVFLPRLTPIPKRDNELQNPCAFLDGVPDPGNVYTQFRFDQVFTLPDRLGVSAAVRPTTWLTLVAEGDLVKYSANDILIERFDPEGERVVGEDRLFSDDIWELRGGAEAVLPFARRGLVALRAGYWREPDHSLQYDRCRPRPGVPDADCQPDTFFNATHPATGDLDHYTGGFGVAWAWGQVDVGYDWVRQQRVGNVSVSLVLRAK